MLYSTFTAYLGFAVNEGEYKVMGLASYGRPTMTEQVRKVIRRTSDGGFALDPAYFEFQTTATRSFSSRFVDLFGPPRNPYDPIDLETAEGRRYADIAASVQRVLEEMLVDIARALHRETGLADLCYGGGVALNGVANARLLAESGFERVFVPPAPGDAGCALGAALYADRIHFRNPDRAFPDHPFWGPVVAAGELARAAREDGQDVAALDDAALIDGSPTRSPPAGGRMDGRRDGVRAARAGPPQHPGRAASAEMRDRLNRDIKYREEFRPFAPVVPVEAAETYFELPPGGARLARFMSGVFPVRPEWRARLAAVTHVDGTARLQAVERGMAPRLHALLEAYGRRTGVPVLLNTSFNLAGEPIVTRRWRDIRPSGAAGSTCSSPARRWWRSAGPVGEAGAVGGVMVVRKRSGMRRRLIMLGSVGGSTADLARGLWRNEPGKRWLLPLAVFLCLIGVVLILAASVEALAPFIYAIF